MRSIALSACAAGVAVLAAGCTTDSYGPYYGASQGYAYPSGYYQPTYGYYQPSSSYYYQPRYGYYRPNYAYYPPYRSSRYAYSSPYYYGGGPGVTFTAYLPPGGTVP
jgi:hypothetical protein